MPAHQVGNTSAHIVGLMYLVMDFKERTSNITMHSS